ncbi:MAG TPA: hypothetical protein VGI82_05415 [Chitinophagaceae bacterium]|jgi:hypothetical protein
MKHPIIKNINIFLSLDQNIFKGYFNAQDPAPIYKRQLSHEFEDYIMNCIVAARRETNFSYKISYKGEEDKQYAEPLVYAIRRHFGEKKTFLYASFEKFKRRSYMLLFMSLGVVMICQGLLPLILDGKYRIDSGLANGLDVFSWVILWRPIDKLIFQWNPFLKDISIIDRLEKAEIAISEVLN